MPLDFRMSLTAFAEKRSVFKSIKSTISSQRRRSSPPSTGFHSNFKLYRTLELSNRAFRAMLLASEIVSSPLATLSPRIFFETTSLGNQPQSWPLWLVLPPDNKSLDTNARGKHDLRRCYAIRRLRLAAEEGMSTNRILLVGQSSNTCFKVDRCPARG